jgi:hypothetical protein
MGMGTFLDTINHLLRSGHLVPQHILVEPLVTAGHQAHQIHCLPPPDEWSNRGCQLYDHAHHVRVQFQASPHMG